MPRILRSSSPLAAAVAGLLLVSASPARAVSVAVSPADTTVGVGDTFSLRIVSSAFPDLKAYELIFRYGSTALQYLGPAAGDVLTGSGQPYTMLSLADVIAPPDTAGVDCAQLVGSTSGPGVLVYFQFKAIATGDPTIDCLEVDFRDSHNNQTLPTCAGGVVHVTGPVPARRLSWGRLKAVYH